MSATLTTTTPEKVAAAGLTAEVVLALIERGATEKAAVAVALRDIGKSNAEVGEAFGPIFGAVTKPGGAGNMVTAGLRAIGRDGEIVGKSGTGTRRTTVRDASSLIRDELDRARAALETVTGPVVALDAELTTLNADPSSVVDARIAEIVETMKVLAAEKKILGTTDGASAFVAERVTTLTTKRDAAKTASTENAERMSAEVSKLEATLTMVEAMSAPTTDAPTTDAEPSKA